MQFDSIIGGATLLKGDLSPRLANTLADSNRVAVDTETSGLDWRLERLGLIQLYSPESGVVIIQVTKQIPYRLISLLKSDRVAKVFHYAPFDLAFLCSTWPIDVRAVYCTKIASKLLNPHAPNETHSLQYLYRQHLGVVLQKGAVRISDWTADELSDEQVRYAASDVAGLLALFDSLNRELEIEGKRAFYEDCCAFLPAQARLTIGGYPDVFAY